MIVVDMETIIDVFSLSSVLSVTDVIEKYDRMNSIYPVEMVAVTDILDVVGMTQVWVTCLMWFM